LGVFKIFQNFINFFLIFFVEKFLKISQKIFISTLQKFAPKFIYLFLKRCPKEMQVLIPIKKN